MLPGENCRCYTYLQTEQVQVTVTALRGAPAVLYLHTEQVQALRLTAL